MIKTKDSNLSVVGVHWKQKSARRGRMVNVRRSGGSGRRRRGHGLGEHDEQSSDHPRQVRALKK